MNTNGTVMHFELEDQLESECGPPLRRQTPRMMVRPRPAPVPTAIPQSPVAILIVDDFNPVLQVTNPKQSDFPTMDENIQTDHECPKCGYKWSGSSAPKGEAA